MPDIKTRNVIKGTIKAIDKSAVAAQRMKKAYIQSKDKAEESISSAENTPEEYASDRAAAKAESFVHEGIYHFGKQGRRTVRIAGRNISRIKTQLDQQKADHMKKRVREEVVKNVRGRICDDRETSVTSPDQRTRNKYLRINTADHKISSVRWREHGKKTVKQAEKSSGKAVIKTAQRTVKTAGHTARTTIKTAETTVKTTQKALRDTVRVSQRAVQTARAAARTTAASAKAAAKTTAAAAKAAIATGRTLIYAVIAGGWVAIALIILICLIGLFVGSCFGIFFAGEDNGSGQTIQAAVREMDEDFQKQIDQIKENLTYDVLEMSGSRAVWKDVLAVYAVQTTTDPDQAQEVASMNDSKKAILKDIFWKMNKISSRVETKAETVIEERDDGHGNIVETELTVSRIYLYITVSHKTAWEMADQLGFTERQREQMEELLLEENNGLWSAVLYGIDADEEGIVEVALSQLGNSGELYWSWCANECGYIDAGIIPKFAGCANGVRWFKSHGMWRDHGYEPCPGDIIFFDWNSTSGLDGDADHVGIVEKN